MPLELSQAYLKKVPWSNQVTPGPAHHRLKEEAGPLLLEVTTRQQAGLTGKLSREAGPPVAVQATRQLHPRRR
eukprot:10055157-Karenia_brevis.AAC.1